MNVSYLLHPHFIIKHYLMREIERIAETFSFTGSAVDIGCGVTPYKKLFSKLSTYTGIDYKNYSPNNLNDAGRPDLFFATDYAKTLKLPFTKNSFDHTFSFQVAEHHPNPDLYIAELVRITKKNGTILLSVPFIWGIHERPHDYFRYSEYALSMLLKKNNCKVLSLTRQGALSSTLAMLTMDYAIELVSRKNLWSALGFLLAPCMLLFSYTCILFDRIFHSQTIFLNYVVLAKKL